MLDYSELTIVKNAEGMPTALGYPINSILLQNNRPLFASGSSFAGGGGSKRKNSKGKDKKKMMRDEDEDEKVSTDFEQLAIPAGLVCMTQTICRNANDSNTYENDLEPETIPEGLYEQLLALAETKPPKKMTRHIKKNKGKNKTHKRK